jgi:predicted metal-binding membrane protein
VASRVTVAVATWMLTVAAVAWWATLRSDASSGGAMSDGGMATPLLWSAGVFLAMWLAMVVAMMFPVAVPMVAAHRYVSRWLGRGRAFTGAFVVGYLVVWTCAGAPPLTAADSFAAAVVRTFTCR